MQVITILTTIAGTQTPLLLSIGISIGTLLSEYRQGGNRNKGTQTFPVAFNHVLGVLATRNNGAWEHSIIVSSVSNTGFYSEVRNQANDSPSDYRWYWIAFGRG